MSIKKLTVSRIVCNYTMLRYIWIGTFTELQNVAWGSFWKMVSEAQRMQKNCTLFQHVLW